MAIQWHLILVMCPLDIPKLGIKNLPVTQAKLSLKINGEFPQMKTVKFDQQKGEKSFSIQFLEGSCVLHNQHYHNWQEGIDWA